MKFVSQTTTTPVVETVTVTLTVSEVQQIAGALRSDGWYTLADNFGALTTPNANQSADTYVATGAIDQLLWDQKKMVAIKETRAKTGATLKESKDACDNRGRYIGAY